MYTTLPFTIGLLCIGFLTCIASNSTDYTISFYEYGAHVEGEQISYTHNSFIPPFTPIYMLNVTPTRDDLEKRFTYLRVEYISPMSKVDVLFDPNVYTLSFHVRFPFLNIPYGVVGYSLKLLHTRIWTDSWRTHE